MRAKVRERRAKGCGKELLHKVEGTRKSGRAIRAKVRGRSWKV